MREYRTGKATEFSKKQIGVIYWKAKEGTLKVEKWVISELYDLADYFGYDDNRSVEQSERKVLKILESVFSGNFKKAQTLIDEYTESEFKSLSRKYQERVDRKLLS